MPKRKKDKRGGARKGAGRKPGRFVKTVKKEDTVVIRVPKSLVSKVKEMIDKHRKK